MSLKALIPKDKRKQVRDALKRKDPKLLRREAKDRESPTEGLQKEKTALLEAVKAADAELVEQILSKHGGELSVNEIVQAFEKSLCVVKFVLEKWEKRKLIGFSDYSFQKSTPKNQIIKMIEGWVLEQRITDPRLDKLIADLRKFEELDREVSNLRKLVKKKDNE